MVEDDPAVYWLSGIEGNIQIAAADYDKFTAALREPAMRDEWLLEGFIMRANNEGWSVGPTQCLGWKIPPILGGTITFDNIGIFDLAVYSDTQSQIHRQLPRK